MMIRIDLAGLRKTKWHDYAARFLFGGLITAAAGLIAQRWGPGIGGLFLAFPAIFPASATLVETRKAEEEPRRPSRRRARARSGRAGCSRNRARLYRPRRIRACRLAAPWGPMTWIVLGGAGLLWMGISGLGWRILKLC